jgi:hypothetical protein
MNRAGRSLPLAASSTRATTIIASHRSTADTRTFCPDNSQPSPSRRAVAVIRWRFDPLAGSLIANVMRAEPSAKPGSHRRFCASVPALPMKVAQIAAETGRNSSGHPAAANSSVTMCSS